MRDTVSVTDEERSDGKPKEFDVSIKRVSQVDLGQIQNYSGRQYPQDAIQVLDIVLRHPSTLRYLIISYFQYSLLLKLFTVLIVFIIICV